MKTVNLCCFLLASALLLCQFGCVAQGTYQKKVEETSGLARELADLQSKNTGLARENEGLRTEQARLLSRVDELEAGTKKLEQMLAARTEPSFGMMAELEREKARLNQDLSRLLSVQEGKVRDVSRIYETLLEGMKDEIASGRATVSELRGKITITVRDETLFSGDNVEINPAGIPLLSKIADRLKGAGENEIVIALPFEMPESVPAAAAKNASPAVIPAFRAMAIARIFLKEGIEPGNLVAVARGTFASARDEGRIATLGKAPRVEITVTAGG